MQILKSIYNEVSAYREQFHEETSDIIGILLSKCTTRNNIGTITNGRFEDVCNELNTLTRCTAYLSRTIKAEYAGIHKQIHSYVMKYLILATNEAREEKKAESNDVLFSMVNDMQAFNLNFLSFLGKTETFISEYSDSTPNPEAMPKRKEPIICDTIQEVFCVSLHSIGFNPANYDKFFGNKKLLAVTIDRIAEEAKNRKIKHKDNKTQYPKVPKPAQLKRVYNRYNEVNHAKDYILEEIEAVQIKYELSF